jgi:hypothetical protein
MVAKGPPLSALIDSYLKARKRLKKSGESSRYATLDVQLAENRYRARQEEDKAAKKALDEAKKGCGK